MPRYKRQFRNGGTDPKKSRFGYTIPPLTMPIGFNTVNPDKTDSTSSRAKPNVPPYKIPPTSMSIGFESVAPHSTGVALPTTFGEPSTPATKRNTPTRARGVGHGVLKYNPGNDKLPVGHGVLLHDGMINEDGPVGARSTTPKETITTDTPADVFKKENRASLPEGFGETLTEGIESDPAERFFTGSGSDEVGTPDTPQEGGNFGATALQFLPEAIDFATGVFGKDDVRPATTVSKGALSNFPNKVNVNPQLEAVSRQFRSIVSDPSASMNQKLAALSQTNQAVSQIHGEKTNRENQLASNKARIESRLDSQQAQYNERRRQEKTRADANYGVTGNFARQSVANAAGKGLMMKAEKGQEKRDNIALAAVTAGLSDAARDKLFEILEGAK